MVKIALQMKAQLENIECLSTDQPDFQWFLKIKCTGCGEESDKWHAVSLNETVALKSGRGNTHFACKCKMCGKENQMDIIDRSFGEIKKENEGKFETLVQFDCRGMEPTAFSPREGWIAHSAESGHVFRDVDLSENEWVDYDEKSKVPVGISEMEFQFVRVK